MKKVFSTICALALLASMTACGNTTPGTDDNASTPDTPASQADDKSSEADKPKDGKKTTLKIYAFTEEVPGMLKKYLEMNPDFAAQYDLDVTVVNTTNGEYQPALDQALSAGGKDAPDLYCAEAAFVLKYTQGVASSYAAPYKDLGIDDVEGKIKDAKLASYAVDLGTNPSGDVVGLGYQATGGAFIYRRSIAKDVWGSDDQKTVEEAIGAGSQSWDKFFDAAEELKGKGYAILSGDGDLWHAVENSSDAGWEVDGKLHIDQKRENFLDLAKKLKDNGYFNDTQDWTEAWYTDMKGEGEKGVLGFFGPGWLINYTMAGNCGGEKPGEGTYGDWAVCTPPVGFFWGGTWLMCNKDSQNKEAVGKMIEWITLDTSDTGLQYLWANGTYDPANPTKDVVASEVVMSKSDGKVAFLGDQNMFDVFTECNKFANGKNLTPDDEKINSKWRDQVRQYTAGNKSRDAAIADFKSDVTDELGIEAE